MVWKGFTGRMWSDGEPRMDANRRECSEAAGFLDWRASVSIGGSSSMGSGRDFGDTINYDSARLAWITLVQGLRSGGLAKRRMGSRQGGNCRILFLGALSVLGATSVRADLQRRLGNRGHD